MVSNLDSMASPRRRARKSREETEKIRKKVYAAFKEQEPFKKLSTEELEVLVLEATRELGAREGTDNAQRGLAGTTRILARFYSGLYEE